MTEQFDPVTGRIETPSRVGRVDVSRFAQWQPYRPPWYPFDDNPWEIVSNMSGNVITRYSAWVMSLPPEGLARLIRKHHHPSLTRNPRRV